VKYDDKYAGALPFSSQLFTDHAALLSVILQLGSWNSLYQQPFKTYLHHYPVSAAISKLNIFAWRMALNHRSTFVIP